MASGTHIRELVGQLFIVGFDGLSVPAHFRGFIQSYNLGGVIYFKRNVQSPGQLAELSNELQFICRPKSAPPMFISIDHEGGKVNRLVKPFTKFPGNNYIGDVGSPKLAFQFGIVIGKELKSVGINVNYAPVVDVDTNRSSPVIGSRAFSADPQVCGQMGSAVCRGLHKMGVLAVAKHFPGHGDTREDSHFALPTVTKTIEELERVELIPFRRVIRSRVEALMTAHIFNPNLDATYPTTLSHSTLTGLLRGQLRFSRLIISDDMEMKAITDKYDAAEAAVLAVKAGCDLLIYKGDAGCPEAQIEAIIRSVENKEIALSQIEQSVARIAAAKRAYAQQKEPIDVTEVGRFIGLPDHFRLADMILRKEKPTDEAVEPPDLA